MVRHFGAPLAYVDVHAESKNIEQKNHGGDLGQSARRWWETAAVNKISFSAKLPTEQRYSVQGTTPAIAPAKCT